MTQAFIPGGDTTGCEPFVSAGPQGRAYSPRVFMMDLWATVPYYAAYLTRALAEQGTPVTLGSITYYLDRDCFRRAGLRSEAGLIDLVGRLDLPQAPRRLLKFIEALLNMLAWSVRFCVTRPDIIHIQYLPMLKWRLPLDIWFLRYCKRLGIGLVYTVHDLLPHDTGERHKAMFGRLYRMMDVLICHSDAAKDTLLKEFSIEPGRVRVIPHGPFFYDHPDKGITEVRSRLAPLSELIVLWQGLIFPYKGIDFLLTAWARLRDTCSNARLVIAGTGNPALLDEIRNSVQRLGIEDSVTLDFRFLPLEEMMATYKAADIIVYPYKAITTSGALMTGLTQGKAIVATSLPAFTELLKDGENALLVSYGDVVALSSALTTLICDNTLRERLANNARNLDMGDKAWQAIAADTIGAYHAARHK